MMSVAMPVVSHGNSWLGSLYYLCVFFYLTGFAAQKACSRRTNDIITFTSYTRRFFLERLLTNQRFFLFYPEPPH